jgi:AcrR family transcriptional regulator
MEKSDIRQRIIDTSAEMFTSFGYSRTSMDDLATKLGMSKKTLYQYFQSKDLLLSEIVDRFVKNLTSSEVKIVENQGLEFPEKITQIYTLIGTRLSAINPYFIEDIYRNAPSVWQSIQQYKSDAAFRRFNDLLEEGVKKGFIKKNVNKAIAVLLYASAIETIFNPNFTRQIPQEMLKNLPYSSSAMFEGVAKIIFEGILN